MHNPFDKGFAKCTEQAINIAGGTVDESPPAGAGGFNPWSWEDFKCCGATKPRVPTTGSCAREPRNCRSQARCIQSLCLQQEKRPQWEARTLQPRGAPPAPTALMQSNARTQCSQKRKPVQRGKEGDLCMLALQMVKLFISDKCELPRLRMRMTEQIEQSVYLESK